MSNRRRLKGRFAAIPEDVLTSDAWKTLPHSARTTLLVLAAQYHGKHNGVQVLTRAVCKEFGIVHDTALRDAQELERRGLIVRTYRAKYNGPSTPQRRVPSMWAVAWHQITHSGGEPLDSPKAAPIDWARWGDELEIAAAKAKRRRRGAHAADNTSARGNSAADNTSAKANIQRRQHVGNKAKTADNTSAADTPNCRRVVVEEAKTADNTSDLLRSGSGGRPPSRVGERPGPHPARRRVDEMFDAELERRRGESSA